MLRWVLLSTLCVFSVANIKDCNTNSVFRPTALGVSPDPPIPGKPVDLTLIFDNTGPEINDGTISTSLIINGLPFPTISEPLCDIARCPITPGSNNQSTSVTWPQVSGNIKSQITWNDVNGQPLLCLNMNFKVPSGNFWNIFGVVKNLYYKNKGEVYTIYHSLKTMAEKNNLRGILNTIVKGPDDNVESDVDSGSTF